MSSDIWTVRCSILRSKIATEGDSRLAAVLSRFGLQLPKPDLRAVLEAAQADVQSSNSRLGKAFEKLVADWTEENILPYVPGADDVERQWLPPGANSRRGGINPLDLIVIGKDAVIGLSPKYSGSAGDATRIWRGELQLMKDSFGGRRCLLLAVKGNGSKFPEALRQGDDPRIVPVDFLSSDSRSHAVAQVRLLVTTR